MSNHVAKHLASIQPGTLFAGVDLSLDDLVVVVLDPTAKRLDRFRSDNNAVGYADFRHRAQRVVEKHHAPGLLIGMEPTNYYWKQFGYDLEQHHLPFRLVNALTVKRHREGDQLDRSKDDWRDAFTIADLLRQGKFTETRLPHGVYAELQTGYVAYQRLRRDRGRQTTLLVNTVRQLFPEFDQVFKDVSGATAAAIIESGLLPRVISTGSEAVFLASVRSHFTGHRLSVRQVRQRYALAKEAYGCPEATTALRLMAQQHVEAIRLLDLQAKQLLDDLVRLFHTLPEAPYLLSIQGLTAPSALGLVAYIGDLMQYPHGGALIKLAGTQPTPNTSGRKTYSPTPFSHQGRSGLRTVLYFITLRLIRQNDAVVYHYRRLTTRAEHPLPKMQAIGACMNKLLWYCWHVVKRREMYEPHRWQTLS
ncbi:MAG: IS110 family transposase [Chloroflexi bacterium]|nr:IS110 family transposase [Chloroflexota bacterium]